MGIRSRITSGIVGLAVLALGGVTVATVTPSWGTGVRTLDSTIRPHGAVRHLQCAGGILGHIGDSADITSVAKTTLISEGGIPGDTLHTVDGSNGRVVTPSDATLTVVGTESASLDSTSLAGYLATECGDALNDQWLVGGSTTTGRDSIISLSNGGDVEAHVDLEVWGSHGAINAPGSRGIVIPAHGQRSYSLAGFAPDEPSPAVRVVGAGAGVWATIQLTTVRGLQPGGLDRIGPATAASTRLDFPIVRIPTEKSVGPLLADPAFEDIIPTIRLLNPGTVGVKARIALTPLGDGEAHAATTTLDAGIVTDIPLADLTPGDWAIAVTAVKPVVGAVRTGFHNKISGITDIAWESAAPVHAGNLSVDVPLAGVMGITNPGATSAHVGVVRGDVITYVDIPAGGAIALPVGLGAVTLQSHVPIGAAVFLEAGSGIATIRAIAPPLASGNVVIVHG